MTVKNAPTTRILVELELEIQHFQSLGLDDLRSLGRLSSKRKCPRR